MDNPNGIKKLSMQAMLTFADLNLKKLARFNLDSMEKGWKSK